MKTHDELLRELLQFVAERRINNMEENIDCSIGYNSCLDDLNTLLQRTEFHEVRE